MGPGLDGTLTAIYGVYCGAGSRIGWWRLEAQAAFRLLGVLYAGVLCLYPGKVSYAGELESVRTGTGPCVAMYVCPPVVYVYFQGKNYRLIHLPGISGSSLTCQILD
jgi:hypothetical protein